MGNVVGTDISGSYAIPNATGAPGGPPAGILLASSSRNRIGDGQAGGGNLISGNVGYGIQVWYAGSDDNLIQGNFIGTDKKGSSAISNGGGGISSGFGARRTIIGTDGDGLRDDSEGNLISGDTSWVGVGLGGTGDVLAGNKIGTDATGLVALPNLYGVIVSGSGARVGSNANGVSDQLERNIIAGNIGFGLAINYGGSDSAIAGNWIGINVQGEALGNGGGILLDGTPRNNLIGSNADGLNDEAERNVVSGNRDFGIRVSGRTLEVVSAILT